MVPTASESVTMKEVGANRRALATCRSHREELGVAEAFDRTEFHLQGRPMSRPERFPGRPRAPVPR